MTISLHNKAALHDDKRGTLAEQQALLRAKLNHLKGRKAQVLTAKLEEAAQTAERQLSRMEKEIDERLTTFLKACGQECAEIAATQRTLEGKLQQLDGAFSALLQKQQLIYKEIATKETELTQLSARYEALKSARQQLRELISTTEGQRHSLQAAVDDLREKTVQLYRQQDAIAIAAGVNSQQIAINQSRIVQLEAAISQLSGSIGQLSQRYDRLEVESVNHSQQIDAITTELKTTAQQLTEMQKKMRHQGALKGVVCGIVAVAACALGMWCVATKWGTAAAATTAGGAVKAGVSAGCPVAAASAFKTACTKALTFAVKQAVAQGVSQVLSNAIGREAPAFTHILSAATSGCISGISTAQSCSEVFQTALKSAALQTTIEVAEELGGPQAGRIASTFAQTIASGGEASDRLPTEFFVQFGKTLAINEIAHHMAQAVESPWGSSAAAAIKGVGGTFLNNANDTSFHSILQDSLVTTLPQNLILAAVKDKTIAEFAGGVASSFLKSFADELTNAEQAALGGIEETLAPLLPALLAEKETGAHFSPKTSALRENRLLRHPVKEGQICPASAAFINTLEKEQQRSSQLLLDKAELICPASAAFTYALELEQKPSQPLSRTLLHSWQRKITLFHMFQIRQLAAVSNAVDYLAHKGGELAKWGGTQIKASAHFLCHSHPNALSLCQGVNKTLSNAKQNITWQASLLHDMTRAQVKKTCRNQPGVRATCRTIHQAVLWTVRQPFNAVEAIQLKMERHALYNEQNLGIPRSMTEQYHRDLLPAARTILNATGLSKLVSSVNVSSIRRFTTSTTPLLPLSPGPTAIKAIEKTIPLEPVVTKIGEKTEPSSWLLFIYLPKHSERKAISSALAEAPVIPKPCASASTSASISSAAPTIVQQAQSTSSSPSQILLPKRGEIYKMEEGTTSKKMLILSNVFHKKQSNVITAPLIEGTAGRFQLADCRSIDKLRLIEKVQSSNASALHLLDRAVNNFFFPNQEVMSGSALTLYNRLRGKLHLIDSNFVDLLQTNKLRPVVILRPIGTGEKVLIAPITSNVSKIFDYEVFVELKKPSKIVLPGMTTIERGLLKEQIGEVDEDIMEKVIRAMKVLLAPLDKQTN